jgi:hypothetical protein
MLPALTLIGGMGLGLGVSLTIVFGIEIALLYFLTWEFLRKENLLVYSGIIVTALWAVIFGLYSDQIVSLGIDANLVLIMEIIFAAISISLALAPLIMYATKASSFGTLRKQFNTYRQQYEERNSKGDLTGNIGLVNQYTDIKKGVAETETDLNTIDQAFDGIKEKYNLAKKSPELIFTPLDDLSQAKKAFARPNINYVVVGVGGTGIDFMTALIDNLDSAGAFVTGEINPFAFFGYDTDIRKLKNLATKYQNQAPIPDLIHCKPELNNSLTESELLLSNPWLEGEPVSIMSGTGNRRGIGAAAYNVVGESLVDFMIQEIDKLRQKSSQNNWVLIVLNSLGGGTGSGSFIRLTMDLLKRMEERIQIRNPLVLWFGILPKNSEGDIYKVNAYAAIKEMQFLFERSERVFGQATNDATMTNPFDACFLLSRENPSQKRDEELTDALIHFMTEIGFIPSGHTTDVRLDINDLRTRLNLAANSFGTLNYYQVYFPASILSWYRNYAKPVLATNREKFDTQVKKADTLLKGVESAEIAARNYLSSVDSFNLTKLMPFKELRAYKKWTEEVQTWNDQLNTNVSSLKNQFNFEELKNKIATIRQTTVFKVQQERDNTNALVESEKQKMINPDISDVYKQVPIQDPDAFDLSQLTDTNATLRSLMDKSGRISLLQEYLKPLTYPLGGVGMPLANLDFAQMKKPINLGTSGTEFVEAYQPKMIGRDRYRNKIVVSPRIRSVILLASSATDNLQSPFPTPEEIKGNLVSSVEEEGNAEVSLNKVSLKRFTTSVYWMLSGLHIWKLLPKEPPILKDLAYLSDAYDRAVAGRHQDLLDLFRNHTLFYNDSRILDKIIGPSTKRDYVSRRDRTTEFWANYNPSDIAVGVWGTILLATVYDTADTFAQNLENLTKQISIFNSIKDISEIDFRELKKVYDEFMDNLNQKFMPDLEILADSYRTLEKGKTEIAEGLSKVIEQISEIHHSSNEFLDNLDDYKKRLSILTKGDDLLSRRVQSQIMVMITEIQRTLKILSKDITNIVKGKGQIIP